jgi:LysM repeat protein
MRHRSPARWLAPVALLVCAVAAISVVQSSTSSDGDERSDSTQTTKTAKSGSGSGQKKTATKRKRTYTVKPGDVLGAIAEKNGTTIEELQALNPSLDAATLRVGQKIRLPR